MWNETGEHEISPCNSEWHEKNKNVYICYFPLNMFPVCSDHGYAQVTGTLESKIAGERAYGKWNCEQIERNYS